MVRPDSRRPLSLLEPMIEPSLGDVSSFLREISPRKTATMKARVIVTLKDGILDPQGKAIEGALKSLGINGIDSVRQGKIFEIELSSEDRNAAAGVLRSACEKLLANQVIENFQVELP
jgi:phosphoribosylformylglycinamidine synthase PurS subunit